ncbi:PA0069 family radical SAM protein [bacterium]|nr:PA0069 family radical SAM protein [bacterium]
MPEAKNWRTRAGDADWSREVARARGRGARSNVSGRFEQRSTTPFHDGWSNTSNPDWDHGWEGADVPARLQTEAIPERAKSIITYNTSPDISFDRTINPYKGCEHGCIYCYARPNHAYAGLSAGLDFETRIFVKPGAAALLERELSRRSYKPAVIVLGGDTDIYQPFERELRITRSILEVLSRARHPVSLITKSSLILRDLDLIAPMAEAGVARVAISLTSLDNRLSRAMEPRAAAPHRRLEAIRQLSSAGVPVTVMTAPLIPALNDMELERLLEAAAGAGARRAGYVLIRLPREVSALFIEWLESAYPDRARRVMTLIRQMRGGMDYVSDWGARQKGTGPYAQLIANRFSIAAKRLGLDRPIADLRTDLFRPPERVLADGQMSLFGPEEDGPPP